MTIILMAIASVVAAWALAFIIIAKVVTYASPEERAWLDDPDN